jgi:membrane-associated protease RseP (regulator of RpoE activity)
MSSSIHVGPVGLLVLALLLAGAAPAGAQGPDRTPSARKGARGKGSKDVKARQRRGRFFWRGSTHKRAYLGVHLHPLTAELRKHYGAPAGTGLLVAKVDPDSPATRAGIKVGDVLVALDGQTLGSIWSVGMAVRHKRAGDQCQLRVVRKGKELALTAKLVERSVPQIDVSPFLRLRQGDFNIHVDARSFEEAVKQLQRQMKQMKQLKDVPNRELFQFFKQQRKERDLEQRLKQMERKLRRLEKRLKQSRSDRPGRRFPA